MDVVRRLDELLLPVFRDVAAQITAELPKVKAGVYSCPVGSATQSPSHHWAIDCNVPQSNPELPDNVGLVVSVLSLVNAPTIDGDVSWGDPVGVIEAEIQAVPLSEESIGTLLASLPPLYEALKIALRRGTPPLKL